MAGFVSARVRWLLVGLGAAFLLVVLWQAGPLAVAERLRAMGPRWPLVLLPSILTMAVDTVAWRYTFAPGVPVGFQALLRARIAGESINILTPSAYVGGEPVKAWLLAPAVPMSEGLSAAIVGKTLMVLAQVIFVVLGLLVALGRFDGRPGFLAAAAGVVLVAVAGLCWLVVRQQRGFVGWLVGAAARFGIRPVWIARRGAAIADLDARIARAYREERGRLCLSLGLYFLGWVIGAAETYLALALMGLSPGLPSTFALDALAGMAKAATFFIPGSLGGQEGAHAVLFVGFGYPLAAAVAYSVVRRVRELAWAGLGLALLARRRPGAAPPDSPLPGTRGEGGADVQLRA